MCGIAGYINSSLGDREIRQMLDKIPYRGPDDHGFEPVQTDSGHGFFGHRRLSILDLSANGHQPMCRGAWTVVYNGEIFNAPELQEELQQAGYSFSSTCDTEVLLAAFDAWGVEKALQRSNGMFAFAATDGKVLYLARDRWGVKPLYYCWDGKNLSFASELQALTLLPDFNHELDPQAVDEYFVFGCVPAPLTIYRGCSKLRPGEMLRLEGGMLSMSYYWQVDYASTGKYAGTEEEALDELDALMTAAVKRRLLSDVPLGCFLSGGIDSSLITAIAQKVSSVPVKTFSVGFDSPKFNEAPFARRIAEYLGTDHTEQILPRAELFPYVSQLPDLFAEPYCDTSAFPTLLISRVAKQKVTVVLSGDGGDEHFGGYSYYGLVRFYRLIRMLPIAVRRGLSVGLQPFLAGTSLYKYAKNLNFTDDADAFLFYRNFAPAEFKKLTGRELNREAMSYFQYFDQIKYQVPFSSGLLWPALDQKIYMIDDILTKVDRTSMRQSLEVRTPILDYTVTSFANTLPYRMKIRNGENKYILKKLLSRYIPREMWDRPKQGFSIPLADWLKYDLREQFLEMFSDNRESPYYNMDYIRRKYQRFLNGDHSIRPYELWSAFVFENWCRTRSR